MTQNGVIRSRRGTLTGEDKTRSSNLKKGQLLLNGCGLGNVLKNESSPQKTERAITSFTSYARIISNSPGRVYGWEPQKYSWVLKTNPRLARGFCLQQTVWQRNTKMRGGNSCYNLHLQRQGQNFYYREQVPVMRNYMYHLMDMKLTRFGDFGHMAQPKRKITHKSQLLKVSKYTQMPQPFWFSTVLYDIPHKLSQKNLSGCMSWRKVLH